MVETFDLEWAELSLHRPSNADWLTRKKSLISIAASLASIIRQPNYTLHVTTWVQLYLLMISHVFPPKVVASKMLTGNFMTISSS